jgi:hypothetical protein
MNTGRCFPLDLDWRADWYWGGGVDSVINNTKYLWYFGSWRHTIGGPKVLGYSVKVDLSGNVDVRVRDYNKKTGVCKMRPGLPRW